MSIDLDQKTDKLARKLAMLHSEMDHADQQLANGEYTDTTSTRLESSASRSTSAAWHGLVPSRPAPMTKLRVARDANAELVRYGSTLHRAVVVSRQSATSAT